jgi:hypothetical protein
MDRSYLGRGFDRIKGAIAGRGSRRRPSSGRSPGMERLEARALLASLAAGGVISSVADGANYNYTIALNNSSQSSSPIGSFLFASLPGADYLATQPISVTPPSGWTGTITHSDSADGYGIEFVASSAADEIQPGNSLNFSFKSADAPASVEGKSVDYQTVPVGTSFVYPGAPFISGGEQIVVSATATLESIAVTPADPSLAQGETEPLTATGTYSNGSTENLTDQVTWGSSASSVATISNTAGSQGVATGTGQGPTTISAALDGVNGSTVLNGTSAVLQSIAITPGNPPVVVGDSEQLTATGTFSNGSTQNLTDLVTWSSATSTVATISNTGGSQGIATADTIGSSTISASVDGVTATTVLTVTPTLQSITITPANAKIPEGETEDFTATGSFANGTTENLTGDVTWASTNTAAVGISNAAGSVGAGFAQGVGTSTISAAFEGIGGATSITVGPPVLVSISVKGASSSILDGATDQFSATGVYSNGATESLTNQVTWGSTTPAVATISSQGLASGAVAGASTITAAYQGLTGSTGLSVGSPLVTLLSAQPVIKRNRVTQLVLTFSGGLADGVAQQKGLYRLVVAGRNGSFTGKSALKIPLSRVQFNMMSPDTVTLFPRTAFGVSKTAELSINGNPPSGLQDSQGRFIDGDQDGQQGGDVTVMISDGAGTIEAAAVNVDQSLEDLAATPASQNG